MQHSSNLCYVSCGFIDILVFCHTSFIGTETAAAEESTAAMWNLQHLQPTTAPQDCQRHDSRLLQILYIHTYILLQILYILYIQYVSLNQIKACSLVVSNVIFDCSYKCKIHIKQNVSVCSSLGAETDRALPCQSTELYLQLVLLHQSRCVPHDRGPEGVSAHR